MKESTIIISENIYNSEIKEGSIIENIIIINLSEHSIEKITNDGILSAKFRRTFYDNNLNLVSIEVMAPQIDDVAGLVKSLKRIKNEKYEIIKDQNFNLNNHLNKLTIKYSDSKIDYEVLKEDSLGREIMELSKLNIMINKTNKEIIDLIKI